MPEESQSTVPIPPNPKSFNTKKVSLKAIIITVVLVILGLVGLYILNRQILTTKITTTSKTATTSTTASSGNLKVYTNKRYSYSIEIPKDWTIEELYDPDLRAGDNEGGTLVHRLLFYAPCSGEACGSSPELDVTKEPLDSAVSKREKDLSSPNSASAYKFILTDDLTNDGHGIKRLTWYNIPTASFPYQNIGEDYFVQKGNYTYHFPGVGFLQLKGIIGTFHLE